MNIIKNKRENDLYQKYNKYIKAYFYKYNRTYDSHIINELSNDVFMKLNNNINKINIENDGIKKWIYTTCKNIRVDHDRKISSEKNKKYILSDNFNMNTHEKSVEDNILIEEQFNIDLNKFDIISKDIILYKMNGYKNKEIITLMNISERNLFRKINEIKNYASKKN